MNSTPQPLALDETKFQQCVPLRRDVSGVWRVAGTRVPLERVVESYKAGDTPEQIVTDFDTLPLAAVYHVIAYYLTNKEEVEAYLCALEAQGEAMRQKIESRQQHRTR